MSGSIDAGSIECNFRSIENRLESFLKHEIFICSSLFKIFQNALSLSLSLQPIHIQSNFFCCFRSIFLKGFCLLASVRLFFPSFFSFFFFFLHAFKGEFQTYRNLGFLVFSMISFKIDQ